MTCVNAWGGLFQPQLWSQAKNDTAPNVGLVKRNVQEAAQDGLDGSLIQNSDTDVGAAQEGHGVGNTMAENFDTDVGDAQEGPGVNVIKDDGNTMAENFDTDVDAAQEGPGGYVIKDDGNTMAEVASLFAVA